MRQARKRQLKLIKKAVLKTHEEGRLKFVGEDKLEFVEQDGRVRELSVAECAADFWQRWNSKMMSDIGSPYANLGTFEISPYDIKEMVLEVLND
jgi:hypothetical protein